MNNVVEDRECGGLKNRSSASAILTEYQIMRGHPANFSGFTKHIYCVRARASENGRYLTVEEADLEDAGKYVCTASNLVGVATKRYEVEIRGTL